RSARQRAVASMRLWRRASGFARVKDDCRAVMSLLYDRIARSRAMASRREEWTGANADPLEGWSLPAWTYSDPEFFAIEQERVFAPAWQVACHVSDHPGPADWHTHDYLGHSAIVARGRYQQAPTSSNR